METLFENKLHPVQEFPPQSGIYTVYLSIASFLDNLKIPDIQRDLDTSWVENLAQVFTNSMENRGWCCLDRFELVELKGQLNLIDGQHRYQALLSMRNRYPTIPVEVRVRRVSCEQEMNQLFIQVNSSRKTTIVKNVDSQMLINGVRKYLQENYPKFISTSKKPRRPNINLDHLTDKISEVNLGFTNLEELILRIEKINQFYLNATIPQYSQWKFKEYKRWIDSAREKSPLKPLVLGIYSKFEWLDRMLYLHQGNLMADSIPHTPSDIRIKIAKKIRKRVWSKRNSGRDVSDGKCFVCRDTIEYDSFECGHVKSVFYGGENTLDNLEPICGPCNKDMGTQNLLTYKKIHFGKLNK